MKKYILGSIIVFSFLMTACSNETTSTETSNVANNAPTAETKNETNTNIEVGNEQQNIAVTSDELTENNNTNDASTENNDNIDLDLTKLSSTVKNAEMANLLYTMPDQVGKTIRLQGKYRDYYDAYYEKDRAVIYSMDAGGCCPIEFEITMPTGNDKPNENDDIEIVGTIVRYTEKTANSEYDFYRIDTSNISKISQ